MALEGNTTMSETVCVCHGDPTCGCSCHQDEDAVVRAWLASEQSHGTMPRVRRAAFTSGFRAGQAAPSLPGEQVRAVEIALEIEQYVHDRGDFDRGVQTTCSRVRRALSDPDSFINPVPQVGVSEQ